MRAAEEWLLFEDVAHRRQHGLQRRAAFFRRHGKFFQRHAKALFARGAEIFFVLLGKAVEEIENDDLEDRNGQARLRPGAYEIGDTEAWNIDQAWAVRIGAVEIERDIPAIVDHRIAVAQHRHQFLAGKGDLVFFGEAHRHHIHIQSLVRERHADAPAIGREANGVVAGCQVE